MKRIEIFRAGTQTDNAGVSRTFSEADLAACAAAYDPAVHEAPLVIGHPQTDAPAWGWVRQLVAQAGRLVATPDQVRAEFAEQVSAGAYKKVSAAFYSPDHPRNPKPGAWYLRHVGFLGATPPAVKGLAPIEFDDAAEVVVIDAEINESPVPPEPAPKPEPPKQETAVSPEEAAALQAQNEALKKQNEALLADQAAAAQQARHAEHAAFAEKLIVATRLPEADKDRVVAIANALHPAGAAVEFGEGETSDTLYAKFVEFLESLPVRAEYGERATRERAADERADAAEEGYGPNADPERVALHKEIRAYATKHNVDYATAARAVAK